MLYETRIAVKKFGSAPENMTWWEFYRVVLEIFSEAAHGADTWKYYFEGGTEQEEPDGAGEDETVPGQMEYPADYEEGSWKEKEEQVEEIAPAQKDTDESTKREESVSTPEEHEIAEEHKIAKEKHSMEQEETETVQAEPEQNVPKPERKGTVHEENRTVKKTKSRIEYMKGLPVHSLAHYINDEFERGSLTTDMLKSFGKLFEWLNQKMDEGGREG